MTAVSGRSSKRWWRRGRSPVHAPAPRTLRFEFAHLLDPVRTVDRELDAMLGDPTNLSEAVIDEVVADEIPEEIVASNPALAALVAEPAPVGEVDALLGAAIVPAPEPITEPVPVIEPIAVIKPLIEPVSLIESVAEVEEPEPPVVERVAVSRFTTTGLDDDRLPIARRRRRR